MRSPLLVELDAFPFEPPFSAASIFFAAVTPIVAAIRSNSAREWLSTDVGREEASPASA
jgi:hypothetical protein